MTYMATAYSWEGVVDLLREHEPGTILRLPKHLLSHPEDAGATPSVGLPMGQKADFRWTLDDCTGLHVRDFGTHYEAHLDRVDPACNVVEHLRRDAPGSYVAGSTAIGAALGLLLGGSKEAAFAGAGLGALVGLATLPNQDG